MALATDARTTLHGDVEHGARARIRRDLTHQDLVAATHDHGPATRQAIVQHRRMIYVEAAQSPVVEKADLREDLPLLIGAITVVVELLLAASHEHCAAIPASRETPVATNVEVHPLVVGAVEIRQIVHFEPGATPVLGRFPEPVAARLCNSRIQAISAQRRRIAVVRCTEQTIVPNATIRPLEVVCTRL